MKNTQLNRIMVQKTDAIFVTQFFRAPCDRTDIILLVNVPNRITSDWVTSGRVTSDWVISDRVTSDSYFFVRFLEWRTLETTS
ncbi:hypothetical protein EO92_08485 [Methanosarcina sp. 2.H.A.1B.4]|nr:hypothetical protein EO92_08485 [Methanosarcina sp. 2.H.A.1B.4]